MILIRIIRLTLLSSANTSFIRDRTIKTVIKANDIIFEHL